jgi:site-specific DNA recombinase
MFDAYIRVSSVKGRSGESFISPDVQLDTIERLARANSLEIGEVVEEMDVSGSKRAEDRQLGRLVEKVESGESEGIIVWKLSRFSRSMLDAIETATRITDAGGRLIASDFDSSQGMSKALLGLMSGLAEEELDARREGWRQARERAIGRGVPNGRVPYGLRKRPDGRPEIVSSKAARLREAFRLRADGMAETEVARRMHWSHSTTRQRLSNEAYLGVARAGVYRKEDAFPAIIDRDLWDRVQSARTVTPAATGVLTSERLLQGLARCGGCGRTLKVLHRKRVDGSRVSVYYCKNAASEPCLDRAYVHCDALEEYVCERFSSALRTTPRLVDVVAVGKELDAAQRALEAAEAQLAAFVEQADAIAAADFQRGYSARQGRVRDAEEDVRQLSARLPRLPVGGSLIDLWDRFNAPERREVLAGFLGRVIVRRGASSDLENQVVIEWADGSIANDEARVRVAAA